MNIIAINGYSGVGKSTVAKIIQLLTAKYTTIEVLEVIYAKYVDSKYLPFSDETSWEIKSFAAKVKESYNLITGIDFNTLTREEKERERSNLVLFANTVKKALGSEVWCKSLFEKTSSDSYWIIDDLRFDIEWGFLKTKPNTKFIRVNKPCKECGIYSRHLPNCSIGQKYDNDSQLVDKEFDWILLNDGSIEELIVNIEIMLKEWKIL